MYGARAKNVGWRIDYVVVSQRLLPEVMGGNHCPVGAEFAL